MATGTNAQLLELSGRRNPYPGKLGVVEEGARVPLSMSARMGLARTPQKMGQYRGESAAVGAFTPHPDLAPTSSTAHQCPLRPSRKRAAAGDWCRTDPRRGSSHIPDLGLESEQFEPGGAGFALHRCGNPQKISKKMRWKGRVARLLSFGPVRHQP
jgi:hypothetical protein